VAAADVIAKSSFAVAQRMRALVKVRTGKLKSQIVSASTGLNGRVGFASKDVFYWLFVEFGTVRVPARPFVRPGAEAEAEPYVRAMAAIGPKLERDFSAGRLL
jgi:HK97 gp10 family phage protein